MLDVSEEGPGENISSGPLRKSSLTGHFQSIRVITGFQSVVLNIIAYPGGQFRVIHLKEAFKISSQERVLHGRDLAPLKARWKE